MMKIMKYKVAILAGLLLCCIFVRGGTQKITCLKKTPALAEKEAILSPDGACLATVSETKNGMKVIIYNSENGQELLRIDNTATVTWHPDSKSVFFVKTEKASGHKKIFRLPVAGKKEIFLADGESPACSPDGKSLAYVHDGYVWIMNTGGGNKNKISRKQMTKISIVWQTSARAYCTGDGNVWEIAPATRSMNLFIREIFNKYYFIDIALSPDKHKIALSSSAAQAAGGGQDKIWIFNIIGGYKSLGHLTDGQHPSWTQDSLNLVYDYRGNIYKINIKTSNRKRLTKKRKFLNCHPCMSQRNGKCFFISTRNDCNGDGIIGWNDKPDIYLVRKK